MKTKKEIKKMIYKCRKWIKESIKRKDYEGANENREWIEALEWVLKI